MEEKQKSLDTFSNYILNCSPLLGWTKQFKTEIAFKIVLSLSILFSYK